MSSDSQAGSKEMNESDDRNDWTFVDDQKGVSQIEDVKNVSDDNSENSDEEEDDQDTGDLSPKSTGTHVDSEHSDGISVISDTSTHRALDDHWDNCNETLSLSPQAPSQKFTSTNVVFIGGILACVSMIIANFLCTESIETLTPITHNDNSSLLAQRVELLEMENEALRILVDKLMRNSDKQQQTQFKESDRKVKKVKVWTGDGNSVENAYIEKYKKKHYNFDNCNTIELNSDDLYSEYRKNQCDLKKINENKLKTESGSESKTVPTKSKHDKRVGSSPTPDTKPDAYQKPSRKIDTPEKKDKKQKSNFNKTSKYIDKIPAEENLRMSRKPVKDPQQGNPFNELKTKQKRDKGAEKWIKRDFEVKSNPKQSDRHAENIPEVKPPKYRSF